MSAPAYISERYTPSNSTSFAYLDEILTQIRIFVPSFPNFLALATYPPNPDICNSLGKISPWISSTVRFPTCCRFHISCLSRHVFPGPHSERNEILAVSLTKFTTGEIFWPNRHNKTAHQNTIQETPGKNWIIVAKLEASTSFQKKATRKTAHLWLFWGTQYAVNEVRWLHVFKKSF